VAVHLPAGRRQLPAAVRLFRQSGPPFCTCGGSAGKIRAHCAGDVKDCFDANTLTGKAVAAWPGTE